MSARTPVPETRPRPIVHPGRIPLGTAPVTELDLPVNRPHAIAPGLWKSTRGESSTDDAPPETGLTENALAAAIAGDDVVDESAERLFEGMHQRQRKQLLGECARLQMFDFHILAMPQWPENSALSQARRSRDQWVFAMSTLAVVFLGGVANLIPAWLAGPAFGALVLLGSLVVPTVRRWATSRASHGELVSQRRQLLRAARKHIAHIEGDVGLAWQCRPMAEYNPALRQSRFQSIFNLSRTGNLATYIRSRAHARLYLMFLLEAEKAYGSMQTRYLEVQLKDAEQTVTPQPGGEDAEAVGPS